MQSSELHYAYSAFGTRGNAQPLRSTLQTKVLITYDNCVGYHSQLPATVGQPCDNPAEAASHHPCGGPLSRSSGSRVLGLCSLAGCFAGREPCGLQAPVLGCC